MRDVIRMSVDKALLTAYLAACTKRGTDPRKALEFWLHCFIDRTGYAEAVKKYAGRSTARD